MSEYGFSNKKEIIITGINIDTFSTNTWCFLLENKYGQTKKDESRIILLFWNENLKQPTLLEEKNFLKTFLTIFQSSKTHKLFSLFRKKRPSLTDLYIKTIKNLLKKSFFEKKKASLINEPDLVLKNNNTIQNKTVLEQYITTNNENYTHPSI